MKIKMKVSPIKKPVFNKNVVKEIVSEIAEDMQEKTIENAPEDTRTLKAHGIEREQIEASIYGEQVYLDTEAVRSNYPSEYQQSRPDGGYYPFYQEVGWSQHGRTYPGKHYFAKSFDITKWEAMHTLKSNANKVITLK